MDAASYVYYRYEKEYSSKIDEMKLHKLLYFAQRESIIQTGEPLFSASFYGWRFGTVLKEIREAYANSSFSPHISGTVVAELNPVMDAVFLGYAGKDSWSLSRLTHGEISWQNSRVGVPENSNSDRMISLEDIRADAERIKNRRDFLSQMGLS